MAAISLATGLRAANVTGLTVVAALRGPASSLETYADLKELFRHKRREQHVAEFHDGSDVWLRRENLLGMLAHESPFQAMPVVADFHPVRAVQSAHIDGAGHVPRELRTLHEDSELGIRAVGARVQVHRADIDR